MNYYKDPTAWIAIHNVDTERKRKQKTTKPEKREKKRTEVRVSIDLDGYTVKGKTVRINKGEYVFSRMKRAINEYQSEI